MINYKYMPIKSHDTNKKPGTIVKITARDYWDNTATGLIEFAGNNPAFAAILYRQAKELAAAPETGNKDGPAGSAYFYPVDVAAAISRTDWLIRHIADNTPGVEPAQARLADWASDKRASEPHMLIIGIIGLAIPGITLGLIKKRMEMPVIIRADLAAQTDLELAQSITQASHEVVKSALVLAGGEMKKIEPELADWFFGEKNLAFYAAGRGAIAGIKEELSADQLPHGAVDMDGELAIIALSPAVNINNLLSGNSMVRI